jgi:hypothetical protein
MTITTNSSGIGTGKFTIPANVVAGSKTVKFTGSFGSEAEAIYTGVTEVVVEDVNVTVHQTIPPSHVVRPRPRLLRLPLRIDPLAQTFVLSEPRQITAVDLWFTVSGNHPVSVQIRDVELGFPTGRIIDQVVLWEDEILTNGSPTRFEFDSPVYLEGDTEYAIVVVTESTTCEVAIAELGKWDTNANRWVTSQPYQVGTLLSSSNASAWTIHQDKDLAFKLIGARYTETNKTIDLGTVTVSAGTTDLIALPVTEIPPNKDCTVDIELTLPDTTVVTLGDGQVQKLNASITGAVGVKAKLHGTATIMPLLEPGTHVVDGVMASSGVYISRVIPAGLNSKIHVVFDGNLPSGSTVAVAIADGAADPPVWTDIAQTSNTPISELNVEYTHVLADYDTDTIRIKITLTGTPAARPYLMNFRLTVT